MQPIGHPIGPGALVAIVGPSGSGKDTLLRGAKGFFANEKRVVFPRRAITRPAGDDNEVHTALTPDAFERERARGGFALDWRAHGLCYGVPVEIDEAIARGHIVVVNLSRAVLEPAAHRYADFRVASITVAPDILAQRLEARGRESAAEIARRLSRAAAERPRGAYVHEIDNSAAPAPAISAFCALITSCLAARAGQPVRA